MNFFDPTKIQIQSGLEISNTEFPEDICILKPRILPRGGKLVFGGPTKIGKTWLSLSLIRALITGEHAWGNQEWTTIQSKVLFIEKEVGPWGLGERIKKVFKGVPDQLMTDNFKVMSAPRGLSLSSHEAVSWLKGYVADNGVDVVIYDPINKLSHYDENSSTDMLRLVDAIADIADGKAASVYAHHFGKPLRGRDAENADPLDHYSFRGSSRLVDDPDALLTLHRQFGRLVADYESWKLTARLILRHGPSPEDFEFYVNEHDDGRVMHRNIVEQTKSRSVSNLDKPWQTRKPVDPKDFLL